MNASAFIDFLVTDTPRYDAELLKDFRPGDTWIGGVSTGELKPTWFMVREEVRKLAEGEMYRPTRFTPQKHAVTAFDMSLPTLTRGWIKVKAS